MNFTAALPWILPPLLGAIIGYVTNALAIRMIFRPYREWKVLGLRVPFTPGIIPRRRHELAVNIARMVSRQLLTETVLRERVQNETFLSSFERAIAGAARGAMNISISGLEENWKVSFILERLAGWVFPVGKLEPAIARALLSEDAEINPIAEIVGSLRPFELAAPYMSFFDAYYDRVCRALVPILRSPVVRRELNQHGRRILAFAIDQLSSLQRLMVTAGQYDRQMQIKMPEIVDMAIAEFEKTILAAENRSRIRDFVDRWIHENRDRPIKEVIDRTALPETAGLGLIRDLFQGLSHNAGRMIDERQILPKMVGSHIRRIATETPDRTVGQLIGGESFLSETNIHMLARLAQQALIRGLGPLVERLDIDGMVVGKIDSLKVREVEDLLMSILRRHLKWINVFGALLGAIIGTAQFVLARLL